MRSSIEGAFYPKHRECFLRAMQERSMRRNIASAFYERCKSILSERHRHPHFPPPLQTAFVPIRFFPQTNAAQSSPTSALRLSCCDWRVHNRLDAIPSRKSSLPADRMSKTRSTSTKPIGFSPWIIDHGYKLITKDAPLNSPILDFRNNGGRYLFKYLNPLMTYKYITYLLSSIYTTSQNRM